MANTFTWVITQMDTIPNFNGFTNFVTRVYWKYIGTNENNTSSSIDGYVEFDERGPNPYIEYDNITEEEVKNWLNGYTSVGEMQSIISQRIYNIENPPIVNLPFPWIPSPTPTPTCSETPTPTPTPSVTPTITPSSEVIEITPEPTPEITPEPTPTETTI